MKTQRIYLEHENITVKIQVKNDCQFTLTTTKGDSGDQNGLPVDDSLIVADVLSKTQNRLMFSLGEMHGWMLHKSKVEEES